MRRVAVTGIGIVSSIGSTAEEVTASLRDARSGVRFAPDYAELGFRCQVEAAPKLNGAPIDWESLVDRRAGRFHIPPCPIRAAWPRSSRDCGPRDCTLLPCRSAW